MKKDELITVTFADEDDFEIEDKVLKNIGRSVKLLYSEEYFKKENVWAALFHGIYSDSNKCHLNLDTGDLLSNYADNVIAKAKDLMIKIVMPDDVEKIDEEALSNLTDIESPITIVVAKKLKKQLKQALKQCKNTNITIQQKEPTLLDKILHRKQNEETLSV